MVGEGPISEETVYLQDERVTVTNARAVIDGKTFSMANVTSVDAGTQKPKTLWPAVILMLSGLVFVATIVMLLLGDNSGLTCGGSRF